MPESTPRVGRWTSETTWVCPRPCLSPNHVDRTSCDVCHAVRPPLPETPKVGRWRETRYWVCGCGKQWVHLKYCPTCDTWCPPDKPLPETQAPRVEVRDDYGAKMWRQLEEMAQAVKQADADENAVVAWMWDMLGVKLKSTDAQVAGKEPIAGVDDAALHHAVERSRHLAARVRDLHYAHPDPTSGHPLTGTRLIDYADCIDAVCAAALRAVPVEGGADAVDAARYRFLRDNPFQLRAIDGNATWRGNVSAEDFDAHTDVAMANPAFTPTPSEDRPDAE